MTSDAEPARPASAASVAECVPGAGAVGGAKSFRGAVKAKAFPGQLQPHAEAVESLTSEADRDRLVRELLAQLERSASLEDHKALQGLLWAAWRFQDDAGVASALGRGIRHAQAGDLERAERSLRRALRLHPGCFAAVQTLTKVRLLRGDLPGAWRLFRRAFVLEPAHFAAMRWRVPLSEPAHRIVRQARALGDVRHARDLAGFRGPANAMLAWGAQLLGPLAPWLAASLAGLLMLSAPAALPGVPASAGPFGQPAVPPAAVSRSFSLQRTVPTGTPVQVLAGEVAALTTNTERQELAQVLLDELAAAGSARRSLALQDLLWQAWAFHEDREMSQILSRGAEFIDQRRLVEAEAYFQEAVWRDPCSVEGWFRLGQVHYLMGDHPSSLRDLRIALRAEPRHFAAHSVAGLNLLQLGEYQNAADAFRDAQGVLPPASASILASDAEWADTLMSGAQVPWSGGGVKVPALGAPGARTVMFPANSLHPQGGLPRYVVDAINGVPAGIEDPFPSRMLQHSLEEVFAAADGLTLESLDLTVADDDW